MERRSRTYVLSVGLGNEDAVAQALRARLSERACEEVYAPKFEKRIRRQGQWHADLSYLVPGYLFLVSSDVHALADELAQVPGMARLLRVGGGAAPLGAAETVWIERLTRPGHRVVGFSRATMVGDTVHVTSGPLAGYEDQIIKVDRHKRFAWLPFTVMGQQKGIKVGLEVTSRLSEDGVTPWRVGQHGIHTATAGA